VISNQSRTDSQFSGRKEGYLLVEVLTVISDCAKPFCSWCFLRSQGTQCRLLAVSESTVGDAAKNRSSLRMPGWRRYLIWNVRAGLWFGGLPQPPEPTSILCPAILERRLLITEPAAQMTCFCQALASLPGRIVWCLRRRSCEYVHKWGDRMTNWVFIQIIGRRRIS